MGEFSVFDRSNQLILDTRRLLEGHARLVPVRARLLTLSGREIALVEWTWRGTRFTVVRRAAITISWLGNGTIYVLLGALLFATVASSGHSIVVALAAMTVAHLFYPWIKLACARQRPQAIRSTIVPLLPSLDLHSFPSGHVMTMTAAITPVLRYQPELWPQASVIWTLMAWSRMACGHHYLSDILAGALLGFAVAIPFMWL